jgi:hypothetical protein
VYRDNVQPAFLFYETRPGFTLDECSVDKSGGWLLIKEGEDNRIVNLGTLQETILENAAGAHGHFDLGYGYSVGADDQHVSPDPGQPHYNATTVIGFPVTTTRPVVHFNQTLDVMGGAANHISHTNAKPGAPLSEQYACGSSAMRASDSPRRDEIVCFRLDAYHNPDNSLDVLVVAPVMTDLDQPGGIRVPADADYDRAPKGNLDVTGGYFIWTTNMGGVGGRLDAFIVKVPGDNLIR